MSMQFTSELVATPSLYTLDEDYHTYIESMLDYVRNDPSTRLMVIESDLSYHNRFSLNRFLLRNGVSLEDHRLVMRLNGLTSGNDFGPHITKLLVPDEMMVSRLKQMYRTRLKT